MKITQERLREIIREELLEEVATPNTWLRHAAALIRRSSHHVDEEKAATLKTMAEELIQLAESSAYEEHDKSYKILDPSSF